MVDSIGAWHQSDEELVMCAGMEGKELMRVFAKYYSGRSVDESDSEVLDALSMTEYLEYYVCDWVLCLSLIHI